MKLEGKNILLMMPDFYSLRKEIEEELIHSGASVTYIETYVEKENFRLNRTILSFFNFVKNPFYKLRFSNRIKREYDLTGLDYLLVIGIYSGTDKFISYLKMVNSKIITIYYFWDAFITWNFSKYIHLFDYKYTFDRADFNNYKSTGLSYLPLYFTKIKPFQNNIYDITHVGTLSPKYTKRVFVLNKVFELSKKYNLNTFIRLYAPALNSSFFKKRGFKNSISCRINYILSKEYRNHINELKKYYSCGFLYDHKLSEKECTIIESSSKTILDVNINNAGSAYRIIKALSQGKKVITTNPYLKYESFYCSENILIIDKDNPVIDTEFINSEFKPLDIEYLELSQWLNKILLTEC